ncbi:MAG TPA: ABC transporter permease, partial [Longimicrobiales bacterium]|nr:ABC transporter permease [Longimicrobiales bacterium]
VVLLGHDLWQRRFGGRADALGTSVTLNGEPYAVVGVMPPRLNYPYGSELWVPDTFDPTDARSGPNVAARLRDGETLQTTQVALDGLSARAAEEYPDTHRAVRFLAVPQRVDLLGNQPRLGWVLLGAVAFLLLIASANIANLLTVRAVGARRERALHTALGASRWHHLRRLTVESGVLALVGGALGVLCAGLLLEPMAALSVPATDSLGAFFTDLRLDGRVLAFAAATTLGVTLLFGVGPALRALREDPMSELRVGRGGSTGGRRLGAGLVVTEVAMAMVLLAGATLLVRDYRRLQSVDPGFETDGRVVVSLTLPADEAPPGAADGAGRLRFLAEVADGFRALPGVTDVSWVNHLPVSDGSVTQTISAENGPTSEPDERILANIRAVGPGYFRTMGITFAEGRAPTDAEVRDGARLVVLSRSAADHYWPGLEAVGRRVRPGLADAEPTWFTVVGVVDQVREEWELDDTWYVPAQGSTLNRALVVVRSDGPLTDLTRVARSVVWSVDPDQPVERVVRLPELVAETYSSERLGTGVVGIFALVGLLLSVLGIYGVVSYTVSGDLRAMGIRLALGAGGGRVKSLVLRQGGVLVVGGLGLGTLGAVILTRGLARFLVGDGRLAVHTLSQGGELRVLDYVAVVALLGAVALLACYLPARRAARVDPMRILRED